MTRNTKRRRAPRSFASDEGGGVAVYMGVIAAVLIGAAGIAVDAARLASLNTELQNAADQMALAAAVELDGRDSAITRATDAATLTTNRVVFADSGSRNVTVSSLTFLRALGADRGESCSTAAGDVVTTDPNLARFVMVQTETRYTTNPLIAVIGGPSQTSTRACAVAGYNQAACGTPPLMICNPFEDIGGEFQVGQQIKAKAPGDELAQWAPGNFGLLYPPWDPDYALRFGPDNDETNAKIIAHFLATYAPDVCYPLSNLRNKTGQTSSMRTALNTRFDMYENPNFRSEQDLDPDFNGPPRSNPAYRPALNVTKGRVVPPVGTNLENTGPPIAGGQVRECNTFADPAQAMKLPRDPCFSNNSCTGGDRFGNGVSAADLSSYWTFNHGTALPAGLTTRYSVYRYEIDNNLIPDPDQTTGATQENGSSPQCYNGGAAPSDDPDRRIIYLAVVNCQAYNIRGNASGFRAAYMMKTFLTEPVTNEEGFDAIYLEVVGVVGPGDDVIRDIVQLYR